MPKTHTYEDLESAFTHAFMRPEISPGYYRAIETTQGTVIIPVEVCDSDKWSDLQTYCEGRIQGTAEREHGFLCRLSASGYLDCTEWHAFENVQDAIDYLMTLAPDDDDCESED